MTIRYNADERHAINEVWLHLQSMTKKHLNEPDPLPVIEAAWQRQWGVDKVNARAQLLATASQYAEAVADLGACRAVYSALWNIGQPRRDLVALVWSMIPMMEYKDLKIALDRVARVRHDALNRHTKGEEIDS